jgi:voltage-gated potassium channel
VRVVFSLRLVTSLFRRGHLSRFLLAAAVLALNGAAIIYLYERHAPGANIHNFGQALWFSVVTVTTVGYGDYTPVTTPGRLAAVVIMVVGVLILAIVTANVAASFFAPHQGGGEVTSGSGGDALDVSDDQFDALMAAIQQLDSRMARLEAGFRQRPAAASPTDDAASEGPDTRPAPKDP